MLPIEGQKNVLRFYFGDAHFETPPGPMEMILAEREFQRSLFTHQLTSRSLLSICETLCGKKPETGAQVPQAVV